MNKKVNKRIGPLIEGSESLETADPKKCKFHIRLFFFYNLQPAYEYAICLHPKVCQSASLTKAYFRTEDISCNPDNCPFIKKIEERGFSELTFETLDQEEIVRLPDKARFHLAHQPTWYMPPSDFAEKAIWELFSPEEAKKIEELAQKTSVPGLASMAVDVELMEMIRKKLEKSQRR